MAVAVTGINMLDDDGPITLIEIKANVGAIELIGECNVFTRDLVIDRAHIQRLRPGALGRQGLNEIARKIMEAADVDTLTVHGSTRTTGANIGRPPKPFIARRQTGS